MLNRTIYAATLDVHEVTEDELILANILVSCLMICQKVINKNHHNNRHDIAFYFTPLALTTDGVGDGNISFHLHRCCVWERDLRERFRRDRLSGGYEQEQQT
jgi:hypothetical protein